MSAFVIVARPSAFDGAEVTSMRRGGNHNRRYGRYGRGMREMFENMSEIGGEGIMFRCARGCRARG